MQIITTSPGRKVLSWLLALAMLLALLPTAFATDTEGAYVLMNIPYGEFYAAEKGESDTAARIDAVSSATKSKTMNKGLAANSYHVSDSGEDITGITYPVYVADKAALDGLTKVDSAEALFHNESYAYCTLESTPASYKTLTVMAGSKTFSKASGTVQKAENVTATLSTEDHHVNYAINVTGLAAVTADNVCAATIHTTENKIYGLRHVSEIWRGISLGFNAEGTYAELVGKTVNAITYYLSDGTIYTFDTEVKVPPLTGVTATVESVDAGTASTTFALDKALPGDFNPEYSVNLEGATVNSTDKTITLPAGAAFGSYTLTITDTNGTYAPVTAKFSLYGYVLMNIPYKDFYSAEKGKDETAMQVDAVSSATKSKTRSTLAAGSYHKNSDGSDISGIIYPVQIGNQSALSGLKEVKDSDALSITVSLRGQETTTTYTGKDTLFENGDYAYYVLSEKPAAYKTLSVRRGQKSFGQTTSSITEASGAAAALSTEDRHVDYAIHVTGLESVKADNVSAVTLHTTAGEVYGLRHVYEIWRGTSLGFNADGTYAELVGKTVDKITYYLNDGSAYAVSTISPVTDVKGTTVDLSKYVPNRSGYDFAGWYLDKNLTKPATTVTLNKSATIYAKWTEQTADTPTPAITFGDVPSGAYYTDAVDWAVAKGITDGTGKNTAGQDMFSPEIACTRAQAVTFLWRAAGKPEPTSTQNPFRDVKDTKDTNWYYKAVLWAVEQGITTGTTATTFSPNEVCIRAQIVTLLYRYEKEPAAGGNSFSDVPADEYYADAVKWAVSKEVTNGTGDGKFSPQADCTRGQIVTFLYRDMVS